MNVSVPSQRSAYPVIAKPQQTLASHYVSRHRPLGLMKMNVIVN